MRQKVRTKATQQRHASPPAGRHPRSTATLALPGETGRFPDQPFGESLSDELDPELRHRVISEVAFHRQEQRGYDEGYERDDWIDAEADVDHIVIGAKPG